MACLDTSAVLDLMGRGGSSRRRDVLGPVRSALGRGEYLATTRFTVAELWVGIGLARDAVREEAEVEAAMSALVVLDFDQQGARTFARIQSHLRRAGLPSGDMDVLIASVTLTNGHRLITGNPRHFIGIPDLVVDSY